MQATYGGRRPLPWWKCRHWGHARSTCNWCSGNFYPERMNARLNERAAASLADYIEESM